MSDDRKRSSYKDWMNPDSNTPIPRTTQFYKKQRKEELSYIANSTTLNSSDSETENDTTENLQRHIEQASESRISCENDEIPNTHNIYTSTSVDDENDIHDDDDWINVLSNFHNAQIQENYTDEEDEEESEDQVSRENIKLDKKQCKNKKFLNTKSEMKTDVNYGEIILMCMLLGVRHSLTWAAMLDIINLINKLFNEDIIQLSKYKLFNFFPERKNWITYHIYCATCKGYVGDRSELHDKSILICSSCKATVDNVKKAPYFLTLDVTSQLKEFFENPLIQPHLKYRFNRQKKNNNNIEDIFDGNLYKKYASPGNILNDEMNFSYSFNTDGCKAADSSPVSVWPIYLSINELPPKIRKENLILVGLWVNEKKPTMNTFLQPVINELNKLSSKGVEWQIDGKVITSKLIPICCCVDSPCRCSILNMKQYNGHFGCTFCYHPTEKVGRVRKYPITAAVPALRTQENIIEDMISTRQVNESTGEIMYKEKNGVKGPSILMNLTHFNMSDGMTPESMHSVYLGVVEQYTSHIFSASNEPYYVGSPNNVSIINKRLLSFKVPKVITRTPRSLAQRNQWKASEWRSWLLYYSLICLDGILPSKYLSHLSCLVCGITILLQDSISQDDIICAKELLTKFVVYLQEYFGKEQMTFNVHLLLHLPNSVKNLGPLFVHDAFVYENENRFLLHMKKSPTEVAVQIAKRYLFYRSIPLFSTYFTVGRRVLEFTEDFENRVKSFVTVNKTVLLGNGKIHHFNESEQSLHFSGSCLSYEKMIHDGKRYATQNYCKNLKINDSVIQTVLNQIGIINNICLVNNNIVIFCYLVQANNVKVLNIDTIKHIKECFIDFSQLTVFTPEELKNQCLLMTVNNKNYVSAVQAIGD